MTSNRCGCTRRKLGASYSHVRSKGGNSHRICIAGSEEFALRCAVTFRSTAVLKVRMKSKSLLWAHMEPLPYFRHFDFALFVTAYISQPFAASWSLALRVLSIEYIELRLHGFGDRSSGFGVRA